MAFLQAVQLVEAMRTKGVYERPPHVYNKKESLFSNKLSSVPREGLEPSRPCEQQILSLPCLPFHHQGSFLKMGNEKRK